MNTVKSAQGAKAQAAAQSAAHEVNFASKSVPRHLARGAIGVGLIVGSIALVPVAGPATLLAALLALVAFRGCPACWMVGLAQTISRAVWSAGVRTASAPSPRRTRRRRPRTSRQPICPDLVRALPMRPDSLGRRRQGGRRPHGGYGRHRPAAGGSARRATTRCSHGRSSSWSGSAVRAVSSASASAR
ncbi:hypothetical protein ACR820_00140 [Streptomyces netropsis]